MQFTEHLVERAAEDKPGLAEDELHAMASHYINESNRLIFQELPHVISQIIEHEIWKKRTDTYKNFGEYVLGQSPDGLGITSNELLWLLRAAMNKGNQHAAQWGDVLGEVDTSVRMFAKEKKIPIRDLHRDLTEQDSISMELAPENTITYLPSRSKSTDGQLLKLRVNNPEAYEDVIQGKMKLKEAMPQPLRKKLQPIESVKNKFSSLSKSDREAFLAWIEQERENLV